MTRALSTDLRERVIAALGAGASCREAAARFGVAVSSVVKWSQRHRATGSLVPGKMGGHRKPVLAPYRAFIIDQIERDANLSLHRLKDILAAQGLKVSHNTIWLFLRREGLSFKKNAIRP
jgi:transposase